MTGVPPRPAGRPARQDQLTRDDLRGLRRWVTVAGVWAVAATAIALIALLDTSDRDAQRKADTAGDRVTRTERKLDGLKTRLDGLKSQLDALPRPGDVSMLEGRLSKAESDAAKAAKDAKSAQDKLTDLEKRVKTLEDSADSAGGTDTTPAPP